MGISVKQAFAECHAGRERFDARFHIFQTEETAKRVGAAKVAKPHTAASKPTAKVAPKVTRSATVHAGPTPRISPERYHPSNAVRKAAAERDARHNAALAAHHAAKIGRKPITHKNMSDKEIRLTNIMLGRG